MHTHSIRMASPVFTCHVLIQQMLRRTPRKRARREVLGTTRRNRLGGVYPQERQGHRGTKELKYTFWRREAGWGGGHLGCVGGIVIICW